VFLDEPISGLNSATSLHVMSPIVGLALPNGAGAGAEFSGGGSAATLDPPAFGARAPDDVRAPLLNPPRASAPRPLPSSPYPHVGAPHEGRHGRPHLPRLCHCNNDDKPRTQRSSSGTPPSPLALRQVTRRQCNISDVFNVNLNH
jgi:hypothetical protein